MKGLSLYLSKPTCEELWQSEAEMDRVPLWETCKNQMGVLFFQFFKLLIFVNFDMFTISTEIVIK